MAGSLRTVVEKSSLKPLMVVVEQVCAVDGGDQTQGENRHRHQRSIHRNPLGNSIPQPRVTQRLRAMID
ncbi:MAG: hypothetical protein R3C68_15580 [Myxococcota bacterium]